MTITLPPLTETDNSPPFNVYPVAAGFAQVATGDFFGQGRLDVATIAGSDSSPAAVSPYRYVAVAPNVGDGTFGTQANVSLGNLVPLALASGDFTGDGRADLAVAGYLVNPDDPGHALVGSNCVAIFPALGNGTFGAPVTTALGDMIPEQLDTGVFRGDGHLGLAVSGEIPSIVGADGTIPSSEESSLTFQQQVVILAGRGTGTFDQTAVLAMPSGFVSRLLQVGNFIGNSVADLAYVSESGSGLSSETSLAVLPNRGDGTFSSPVLTPLATDEYAQMVQGHFTGSGRIDLALSTWGLLSLRSSVVILQNMGGGRFDVAQTDTSGLLTPSEDGMLVGDFSGTGRDDIALIGEEGSLIDHGIEVLRNEGNGGFQWSSTVSLLGFDPTFAAAGEFTADGRTDVLAGTSGVAGGTVELQVIDGRGDGTFATASSASTDVSSETSPVSPGGAGLLDSLLSTGPIMTGDFNGDGRLDVATSVLDGAAGYAIDFQFGNGDGTLAPPVSVPLGLIDPVRLLAGDFTGNGRTDLFVIGRKILSASLFGYQFGSPVLALIPSLPGGSLGAPELITTDLSQVDSEVTGNLTGNGITSVALAGQTSGPDSQNVIEVLGLQGDGAFAKLATISLGSYQLSTMVAGDFTGHGRTDLVVAEDVPVSDPTNPDAVSTQIVLLRNEGSGLFQQSTISELGNLEVQSLVTGDFSGDGDLDLAYLASTNPPPTEGSSIPPYPSTWIAFLKGEGDGQFQPIANQISTAGLIDTLTVASFDGNGHPDLVVSTLDSFIVYMGLGNDEFLPPITSPPLGALGALIVNMATGDFNGDGRDDIAINAGSGEAQIALGLGNGTFVPADQINSALQQTPVVGDVNGDGVADVLTTNSTGDILFRQGRSSTPGTFDPAVVINAGIRRSASRWYQRRPQP